MASYSSTFNEILPNGVLNNAFLDFFDTTANKLIMTSMPPQVVQNSEDIAILTGLSNVAGTNIATLQAQVQQLQAYITQLKVLIGALKECVFISDASGQEISYNGLI